MIGKTISHFKVLKKLGVGGMGEVYLAEDTRLGRKVALKLIAGNLAMGEETKRRFFQEAQAASALNHPHILTIFDIGSEDGRDFIAILTPGVRLTRVRGSLGAGDPTSSSRLESRPVAQSHLCH